MAIIDAIELDVFRTLELAERVAGEMVTSTALALLLRPALEELASYWPEPDLWIAVEKENGSLRGYIGQLEHDLAEARNNLQRGLATRPPSAIDWPDEDEPAGVTVAALEPEWDGHVWDPAPDHIRTTIRSLQATDITWRHVEKNTRLELARHVLAVLHVPPLKVYNDLKPDWMPMGSGLMSTFRLTWTQLLALGSPWP